MRRSIIILAALAVWTLPAAAETQGAMTIQESENGDCRAELRLKTDDGSIIAGCRASTKSKEYETYWMKADKNGNQMRVAKRRRNSMSRAQYLQRSADGSSLAASYETSPGGGNHVLLMLKNASGEAMLIPQAVENALFQKILSMDREMWTHVKDVQRHLRRSLGQNHELEIIR